MFIFLPNGKCVCWQVKKFWQHTFEHSTISKANKWQYTAKLFDFLDLKMVASCVATCTNKHTEDSKQNTTRFSQAKHLLGARHVENGWKYQKWLGHMDPRKISRACIYVVATSSHSLSDLKNFSLILINFWIISNSSDLLLQLY